MLADRRKKDALVDKQEFPVAFVDAWRIDGLVCMRSGKGRG